MDTRILNTQIYRDSVFRELTDKDRFITLFLLTNEYLECLPCIKLDLDLIAFHCKASPKYIQDLLPRLSYFEIFYVDGHLLLGEKFTYANYKGGKTEKKKDKLMRDLPKNILVLLDSEGNIAQRLGNDCSTIEHINHKPEIINHKSEIINHKKQENLEKITQEDKQEIAEKYQVPIEFVESKLEDLINYCESTGKKYKNYKATLRNWVKRDRDKLKMDAITKKPIVVKI